MKSVLRTTKIRHNGTIFSKGVHLLAYAHDIDIIERNKRDARAAFSAIELLLWV